MLFFSLFMAGFTLGIFAALYIFKPETNEDAWDVQNIPVNTESFGSIANHSVPIPGGFKKLKNFKPETSFSKNKMKYANNNIA